MAIGGTVWDREAKSKRAVTSDWPARRESEEMVGGRGTGAWMAQESYVSCRRAGARDWQPGRSTRGDGVRVG